MYRVLTSEVIQNTRFESTYTPIIRTTGYMVSTLINTDLIYSGSMLKKKNENSSNTKQLPEKALHVHVKIKRFEFHNFLNIDMPPLMKNKALRIWGKLTNHHRSVNEIIHCKWFEPGVSIDHQ